MINKASSEGCGILASVASSCFGGEGNKGGTVGVAAPAASSADEEDSQRSMRSARLAFGVKEKDDSSPSAKLPS